MYTLRHIKYVILCTHEHTHTHTHTHIRMHAHTHTRKDYIH